MEQAWIYDTGEKAPYQTNPLIIEGILYTVTPTTRRVVALNAATGQLLWQWQAPEAENITAAARRSRGLVYWANAEGGEARLFSAFGTRLYAIDPFSGKTIESFGQRGSMHLGAGLDDLGSPIVQMTTPGVVFRDLLIFGVSGSSPRGIRALDVRTGEIRWHFHTVPRPGEPGYDTWPVGHDRTGAAANDWSGQALDEERGIIYASTESPEPDYSGAQRHGKNLYSNCLIALDAASGGYLWHFQIVHHDLLDKDLPCAPVLLTVTHEGIKIDAVAQATKHGLLFVFDRVTGQPLWPVEERPVQQSELPGEQTWPTQPFPSKPEPLMRQAYTEADASNLGPEAFALSLARIRASPNFGPFPAPSLKETVMFPGPNGGMEWGGGAATPSGVYFVNVNEIPWIRTLVEARRNDGTPLAHGEHEYRLLCASCHGLNREGNPSLGFPSLVEVGQRHSRQSIETIIRQGGGMMPPFDHIRERQRQAVVDYILEDTAQTPTSPPAPVSNSAPHYVFGGWRKFLDREGYPAIRPPWGTLNAVDLNTGEIKWQVPLGEHPELTARGIPPTGTENFGGPIATAGGLLFIAATADRTVRAFDQETGEIVWQRPLPLSGVATPATYSVKGRQYVVISAGGSRWGGPVGGYIVAFALAEGAGDKP